jgi:hypothetical protein
MDDTARAISSERMAIGLSPGNAGLKSFLDRLSPEWNRPASARAVRPPSLQLVSRTRGRRFEIKTPQGWQPFYIQGVNLGVTLPGKYPSEFPTDSAVYAGWLDTLAAMHANTLRLYTILPPSFYRALRGWNLANPDRVLWLVHGVWTELPPNHDFDHPVWKREFQAEMRRVVDLIHGATTVTARPGHAAGRYDADVSPWVLGYIIGREWEPFAVTAFDRRHPGGAYRGRYLEIDKAPAMDVWMAQQCDLMLAYEADSYNALRPIAYPDFMILDPGYRRALSPEGPSSYFGYLRELVAHHESIPTIVAEYGIPSSRGNAHLHPQGWGHGGHDERAMAAIDARLTRDIKAAGAAGAIVFAWLDEWFKKNWVVIDYEIPLDNTRVWHNVMDAEQNYGILGMYAGDAAATPRLGGDPELWRQLTPVQEAPQDAGRGPRRLRAGFDESFYYLAIELAPGRFCWDSLGIQIGLDTYLPRVGQHRLLISGVRSQVGFEFLVDLLSPGRAALRVTPEYNRYEGRIDPVTGDDFGRFSRRPVITRNRGDARFDSLFVITNRARFGRDGGFYRAQGYDRGRLRFGTEKSSTLADWYLDERSGLLQLRIPWDLLNVTDPSTRTLLYDRNLSGDFGTATAVDFRVGVVIYRKVGTPEIVGALPELKEGIWKTGAFVPWRWKGWTEPRYSRLKPVYDSLRLLWQEAGEEVPGASAGPVRPEPPAPSN